MGNRQIQVTAHQGKQPTEHHGLNGSAVGAANQTTGELVAIGGFVDAAHHADGPVLQRFGDRGNGVLTHRFWKGRARQGQWPI